VRGGELRRAVVPLSISWNIQEETTLFKNG